MLWQLLNSGEGKQFVQFSAEVDQPGALCREALPRIPNL